MSKTIMIVDDSVSLRQVVGIALRSVGYAVVEAANGQEALDKLALEKIHLIISDVGMPVMDGIAFAKQVKLMPDYKFTPLIMLTTESRPEKKQEGQAAGVKAWMVKPFQPAQLLAAVSTLIQP